MLLFVVVCVVVVFVCSGRKNKNKKKNTFHFLKNSATRFSLSPSLPCNASNNSSNIVVVVVVVVVVVFVVETKTKITKGSRRFCNLTRCFFNKIKRDKNHHSGEREWNFFFFFLCPFHNPEKYNFCRHPAGSILAPQFFLCGFCTYSPGPKPRKPPLTCVHSISLLVCLFSLVIFSFFFF